MNRGELLDLLPDYVHGTLSDDDRRAVDAALLTDAAMARELEIVRIARASLSYRAAPINTDRVVSAIRRPVPMRGFSGVARWRVAAAIATLAVGGASLAVARQKFFTESGEPYTIVGESAQIASAELSVSFGYGLSELPADDLERVIAELEKFDGLPAAEPQSRRAIVPVAEVSK